MAGDNPWGFTIRHTPQENAIRGKFVITYHTETYVLFTVTSPPPVSQFATYRAMTNRYAQRDMPQNAIILIINIAQN